jgi:hypothetical protein
VHKDLGVLILLMFCGGGQLEEIESDPCNVFGQGAIMRATHVIEYHNFSALG